MLIIAGVACVLFGLALALNLRGTADTTANRHRQLGNPRPPRWPPAKLHNYRPQTTRGVRLAGGVFVLAGTLFILISLLLSSFPDI